MNQPYAANIWPALERCAWYVGNGKKNAAVSHIQVEPGRQYLMQLLEPPRALPSPDTKAQ